MMLREIVPSVVAVGVPAVADAVTALDVPVVATATLIAVVWYGFRVEHRLGNLESQVAAHGSILKSHGAILESHGRILESLKHGFEESQGIANRSG